MLGKLLKYDLKSVSKQLLLLSLFVFGTTILGTGALLLRLSLNDTSNSIIRIINITTVSLLVISVISIIAYTIISMFLVLQKYYNSMFTDEGYLTFTLPVTTDQILLSKIINAVLWSIYSFVVVSICIGIMTYSASYANSGFRDVVVPLKNLLWSNLFNDSIGNLFQQMLFSFISSIYSILMFFLAITIGAIIAKKHKILAAIGIFYGASIIRSIVSAIINLPLTIMNESELVSTNLISWVNCIVNLGLIVAAYFICRFMLSRKLNLE